MSHGLALFSLSFLLQVIAADPPADMALIPGGSHEIGRSAAEIERAMETYGIKRRDILAAEMPRHTVRIDPYYIDKHEVTNQEFEEFVRANPGWARSNLAHSAHNGHYLEHWEGDKSPAELGKFPVVFVTWHAAYAYCRWRGKRLPTEAEWEVAARGGLENPEFPWGDKPPDVSLANFGKSGIGRPVQTGSYPANGYGLFDMAGNVWEFCLDEWQPDYYSRSGANNPVSGGPIGDGNYLSVKTRRVIRGGSWGGSALNLRVTYRDSHPPDGAGNHVGFRCACTK